MNETILNNVIYKMICIFRTDDSKDINGKSYPKPNDLIAEFTEKKELVKRLKEIQNNKEVAEKSHPIKQPIDCLLCDATKISTTRFILGQYVWENSLVHYMEKHSIKPYEKFIDFLFNYILDKKTSQIKIFGKIVSRETIRYIKLNRNQLMILDALMRHGGYTKRYADKKNKKIYRYSEHAGFLSIDSNKIDKIIVSGDTIRVDKGDNEIYLPGNIDDALKYEYIFHTHPPTPRPGGRASEGMIYEFPSVSDMLHFIDTYNDGKTIGSLVMTSEGLYNITKKNIDNKKIEVDEDKFYDEMKIVIRNIHIKAIHIHGVKFTTYKFYSQIAQDTQFINTINDSLNKFGLKIDFFPRIRDTKGSWVVDTIHLPILEK
jgi:hypothetical protein